jgi:hypothetical protein
MKLAKIGAALALSVGIAGLSVYAPACSSGGGNADGGPTGDLAKPPAPTGDNTTVTDEVTFAVDSLQLGEAPRAGGPASTNAWKEYGYDIDGLKSDKNSTDVCTPAAGGGSQVKVDGNNGIDNSFGANILPIIQSAASLPEPSKTITEAIRDGSFTLQLKIKGLDTAKAATQTNQGLSSQLFASGKFDETGATKPTFSPNDDWPVRPELLNDGMTIASGSKVSFPKSYIVNGTFVNGSPGKVTISLVFSGVALDLEIQQAIISMQMKDGDSAVNGTISGVLDTEKLIDGLRKVAGRISTSLCGGSTFDGIAQQIRQTSDILADGTNKAGVPCNAISVGLGFTAKRIKNPTKVAPLGPPSPDPCMAMPDGGADSGKTDSGVSDAAGGG